MSDIKVGDWVTIEYISSGVIGSGCTLNAWDLRCTRRVVSVDEVEQEAFVAGFWFPFDALEAVPEGVDKIESWALDEYTTDDVEIDANPLFNVGDDGTWVAAWVLVPKSIYEKENVNDEDAERADSDPGDAPAGLRAH